jgi:hypothetical protein
MGTVRAKSPRPPLDVVVKYSSFIDCLCHNILMPLEATQVHLRRFAF